MLYHSTYTQHSATRHWHVTISCQPDGHPPQPWKSGRVHLAEGSNVAKHTVSPDTGDGLWPLPRHVSWRSRKVAEFARGHAAI